MTKFKFLIPLLVLSSFVALLTSCGKADEIKDALSSGDAVEIIEASLQANSGGLVTNIEDMAAQFVAAVTSGELCNTLVSKTMEGNFPGAQIQASYSSQLSYEMACNALNVPQTVTFTTLTSSMFNSSKIKSDDKGDFKGKAIGLQPSSLTMNIDGNYSRTGTQDLKFRNQTDITSTLTMTLSTLQIAKQNFEIKSGSGTILLSGTTPDETFSFSGNIVFNGGNKATLTINGETYQMDWN